MATSLACLHIKASLNLALTAILVSSLIRPQGFCMYPGVEARVVSLRRQQNFTDADIQVPILLEFRKHVLRDPSLILGNWDAKHKSRICRWGGITCEHHTHRVIGLDLGGKQLEGALTPAIGGLLYLTALNLSLNSFSGHIPPELGLCTSLVTLDLSGNAFTGVIPKEIEYAYTTKASIRGDVYSYGVVLLELLTGRKPTEESGGCNLPEWVSWAFPGRVSEVLDPSLCAISDIATAMAEISELISLALRCARRSPRDRPTMREVVRVLMMKISKQQEEHQPQYPSLQELATASSTSAAQRSQNPVR